MNIFREQESILVDFCYSMLSVNCLQYVLLIVFVLQSFISSCISNFCTAVMLFHVTILSGDAIDTCYCINYLPHPLFFYLLHRACDTDMCKKFFLFTAYNDINGLLVYNFN